MGEMKTDAKNEKWMNSNGENSTITFIGSDSVWMGKFKINTNPLILMNGVYRMVER